MKIHRSHDGMILGVCKGMEESLGIPAKYFRIGLIICAVLFKAWLVLALYLAAALFMPLPGSAEWRFQDNFDSLGRDARSRGRREYRDFLRTMRKSRNSGDAADTGTAGNNSAPS